MSNEASISSINAKFASASAYTSPSVTVSPERAAEVSLKAERVAQKAEAHFEKHRQAWTNRRYGELLARDGGGRLELRPKGMVDDRKAHLHRAARYLVTQKQVSRLSAINRAASRMMGMSNSRDMDRGR